jgi:hypothetical protein
MDFELVFGIAANLLLVAVLSAVIGVVGHLTIHAAKKLTRRAISS